MTEARGEPRVHIGRWILRPDIERTRAAHAALTMSGAAECSCSGCANFEAVRPLLMSGPLGPILTQLGIAPGWEVEAYEMGRAPSGLHCYGAFFHLVGAIESASDGPVSLGDGSESTPYFECSPTLSIAFHADAQLVRPSFRNLPLVQLDVAVELPWLIDADERT
jgi:hypothetical protein